MTKEEATRRYWRATLTLTISLLAVWALAGVGGGVLLAGWLNQFSLGGIPLGFWMAQQGSIVVFVVLIFIYAVAMNRLEKRYFREIDQGGSR